MVLNDGVGCNADADEVVSVAALGCGVCNNDDAPITEETVDKGTNALSGTELEISGTMSMIGSISARFPDETSIIAPLNNAFVLSNSSQGSKCNLQKRRSQYTTGSNNP